MFLSISKTSRAYRLAVAFWAAATTDEAKTFYAELAAATIATGKAIAHTLAYLATISAWGLVLAWGWVRGEAPGLVETWVGAGRSAAIFWGILPLLYTFVHQNALKPLSCMAFGLKTGEKVRRF
jgi:hypothetical protein